MVTAGCGTSPAQASAQGPLVFYRFVSSTATVITAFAADGTISWSNNVVGGTGCFQRATEPADGGCWVDYVQCAVTGATMSLRVFDPSPPPGMAFVPSGINSGTDPDIGAYALTVREFYMDQAHVTRGLWEKVRFWGQTNGFTDLPVTGTNQMEYPVCDVNWYDATKWCNARSEMEGRPVSYSIPGGIYRTGETDSVTCDFSVSGYRLPTMVEWEYAARSGLRGKRYPWGDDITLARLNYDGIVDHTTVAGTYAPNGYDLYDMAGNLYQWTWDWHPLHVGSYRAVVGGSWSDPSSSCRCGASGFAGPYLRYYCFGFRTVLPCGQ